MLPNQLPLERIRSTSGRNSYIFIRSGREQLMFHGVKRSEARQLKGLGDFYLGYRKYAMLEIIGATLLWALFLSTLVPAMMTKGLEGAIVAAPLLALLALLAFTHIGEALPTGEKGV